MKLRIGDTVLIVAGKDKGKTGTIETVFPKEHTVVVPGINMYKRHMKKRDENTPSGMVEKPRPLNVAKVALIDKKTKKQTRIGFVVTKGEKHRVSRKSGELIA